MTSQSSGQKSVTRLTRIDGRDALAFVIIRPGSTPDTVAIEAGAKGLPKTAAAAVLRQVADMWDAEANEQPATPEQPTDSPTRDNR